MVELSTPDRRVAGSIPVRFILLFNFFFGKRGWTNIANRVKWLSFPYSVKLMTRFPSPSIFLATISMAFSRKVKIDLSYNALEPLRACFSWYGIRK